MPLAPTHRRVGLLLAVLTATCLVAVAPAGPARAAGPCLTETPTGSGLGNPGSRCDDATPPATALTGADAFANRNGYLAQDHVAISFAGTHSDADADPIAFECQTYATAAAPADWTSCTSPVSLTDLADTAETPYTFRVRAVDANDRAIDATAGGLFQPTPAATDLPDHDETAASVSFFVDTEAPNTFVFDGPFDEVTPEYPMLTQPSLSVELASNETDAAYACTLKGRRVPCAGTGDGGTPTTFTGLAPGNQALRVTAVDPAGNVDPTPTTIPFSVPENLGVRFAVGADYGGWVKVRGGDGYFARDFLGSVRKGSTLVIEAKRAKELRIIAPVGPRLGRIEIQIGAQQPWRPLDQTASRQQRFAVVYQRFFGRKFSSTISLRVAKASPTRIAAVDAILLH